ncbi:MAG TPA: prephenate dehydrogenase/arogenate dehydrogenase family protein [Acidimicrobiales bacterium]|nr:prephenate dehydrogenase/arogenate dehydrogenase family protein [Acidimicrobiales bacterium]
MVQAGSRRAHVVGLGLIGGSVALGLRSRGWVVTGTDVDAERCRRALAEGVVDVAEPAGCAPAPPTGADAPQVTVVATPAGAVADAALAALAGGAPVVTDVAGVKAPVAAAVADPRFVPGHPMAGSEQVGLDGADPDLFVGATWVLTPTAATDPSAYATVAGVVTALGATPLVLAPEVHDRVVAVVSHVPHLTAATLMNLASTAAVEHGTLLRLAAGGFRDMTRIAAGSPAIWPDVVEANREGIVAVLDELIAALGEVRTVVAGADRRGLLERLDRAQQARVNLPAGAPDPARTAEVRVPVPDRPGVLADVLGLAGELGTNVLDVEIAHSAEGARGVLVLVVDDAAVTTLRAALAERGYRSATRRVGA